MYIFIIYNMGYHAITEEDLPHATPDSNLIRDGVVMVLKVII